MGEIGERVDFALVEIKLSRACRTRLRYLEVRVGVGEDPFPKLKGLITDLINRLSEVQAVKCKEQE